MSDALTMVRRNFRHTRRNPSAIIMTIGLPVVLLLLFVGVFGGALKAGFGSNEDYIDYVLAGVLIMTVGYGSTTTALAVNQDNTEGVIARFRTMAIARTSVLTGHVVGSTVRTLAGALLVVLVALALGLRPHGGPLGGLAAAGLMTLLTV